MLRDYMTRAGLPVGTKMPTAHELADQFHVSYVTMHSALADLVREGWLVRHQGKGTYVADIAKSRARPKTVRIAMVLPPQKDIRASGNSEIVLSFVQGCTQECGAQGLDLAMVSLPSQPSAREIRATCRALERHHGAVFVGTQFAPVMHALKRRQYPYVILAGGDPSLGCEVNYDRPAAVRGAVLHLIEHGYRRIGFLGRMDASATSKFDCFRAALQEQGLPLDPAACSPCASLGEAQLAARRFLESPTIPEAVFVDNYDLAEILVRLTGYHRLRVPDDLAVMAYGTAHRGGVQPPLSLMEVPGLEMGREAAILLNRLIHGRGARSAPILLQAHLTLRRSCGCSGKPSSTTSSPLSEKEVFV